MWSQTSRRPGQEAGAARLAPGEGWGTRHFQQRKNPDHKPVFVGKAEKRLACRPSAAPAWSATNRGNTRDRVGRSTERRGRKAHGWRQMSVLTQARRREAWQRALPFTASGKPVLIPGVLTCGETAASGDLKVPPMARHVWTPEVLKSGEVLERDEVLKKQSRWSPG